MAGEPKQFTIYKDAAGEWRWNLFAANSKKIANSGEGYKNRADCVHGIRLVINAIPDIQLYDHTDQTWYAL